MGYDVSFHPISPEEMREWYFTPLTWIQQGQEGKGADPCRTAWNGGFLWGKYLDTLRVGAGTESNELFDKSHGFYIAVIQGFSEITTTPEVVPFPSWWSRSREYARYFTSWGTSDSCFLSKPACKIGSSKTTAPVYICLQIRL